MVGAEEATSGGTRSRRSGSAPDEPDFEPDKPPDYRPPPDAKGMDAIAGDEPFIMKPDGVGWLFSPGGRQGRPAADALRAGRVAGAATCSTRSSRTARRVRYFDGPLTRSPTRPRQTIPIVACTFRLTEHYLSGPMSRFNSWLNELQPAMFVELSPELAAERGIEHGGWLTVRSAARDDRGAGDGHAPAQAAARSTGGRSTRSACRSTGATPARRVGRHGERPDLAGRRPERQHARGQGVRVPGAGRPAPETTPTATKPMRPLADTTVADTPSPAGRTDHR